MGKILLVVLILFFKNCTPPDVFNPGILGSEANLLNLLLAPPSTPALSQTAIAAGVIDTSFANNGLFIHDGAAGSAGGWDTLYDIRLNGNNILFAGSSMNPLPDADMTVWQLDFAGNLAAGSGSNCENGGIAGCVFYDTVAGKNEGKSLYVYPDTGKILVGGQNTDANQAGIWRLNPDGSLDTSFNGNGSMVITNPLGTTADAVNISGIIVDGTGKIYATGYAVNPAGTIGDFDIIVWRYNPDGTPDGSFNTAGYVTYGDFTGTVESDEDVQGITLDNQGKILLSVFVGSTSGSNLMMRLNTDGTLDTTFNSTGFIELALPTGTVNSSSLAYKLIADNNGSYYYSTSLLDAGMSTYYQNVWKIQNNGSLDTAFGTGGYALIDMPGYVTLNSGINLDAQGNVVLSGMFTDNTFTLPVSAIVFRLTPDGSYDTSFGNNCPVTSGGCVTVNFPSQYINPTTFGNIVIDSIGNIYVGATIVDGIGGDVAVYKIK